MSQSLQLHNHKILVTGASGFMGAWLTQHLVDQGGQVVTILADWNPSSLFILNRIIDRVKNVIGSIEDFELVEQVIRENKIDTVFHLAAISVEGWAFNNPRKSFEINIRGTYNILEACRLNADTVSKVIIASSDKAYGDSSILPYTENLPMQGKHPYEVSKSCADLIARSYYHSYGLPVVVGRFGNIYGGGDLNWSRLIPGSIKRLVNNESPLVRVPKQGSFKRDFLYVQDGVNSYMAMFEGLSRPEVQGEAFNFAMGGTWTILEIVNKLRKLMNCEHIQPVIEQQSHGEIWHQHLSVAKAETILGWTPQYSLDQGLMETIEWYTEFLYSSKKTQYSQIMEIAV